MSPMMKALGIDALSAADRLVLLQEIWDSLAATPEQIPVTESQKQDLDRRLAELDADPGIGLTWEEIKARVRGKS